MKGYKLLLEWYEKDPGNKLIGKEEIHMKEEELAVLIGLNPNKYPFSGGAHPLRNKKRVMLIKELVKHKIDLDSYDYFINARAI